MSVLSKLREALNASARRGETVKVTRGVIASADPAAAQVLKVELTVMRYDCRPAMEGRLVLQQDVDEAKCRTAQGGYAAIAALLWGKLRSSAKHPDHPTSPQALLAGVAAATGMDPADVDAELQEAVAEEVAAAQAQVVGGLRASVKTATVPPTPVADQPGTAPQSAGPGEPTEGAP